MSATAEPTAPLESEGPSVKLPAILVEARREVANAIVGHEEAVELMLLAALARGHVLLEGPPGTAKTLLAQAMARVLGAKFQRVQFTPDTSASDLIGTVVMRGGGAFLERAAIFKKVRPGRDAHRPP